jgi:xanthine dehydrogenase accessory factor
MNNPSIYEALSQLERSGKAGVLCTIISAQGSTPRRGGSKMLVFPDGSTTGTVGGGELEHRVITEALETLREGRTRLKDYRLNDPKEGDPGVCGGQLKIYIEPVMPRDRLVLVGGGHVGREVAHLAGWLGFHVSVCDDRPEYCNPEAVPGADEYVPEGLPEITPWTYAVLTTRNVEIDMLYLPALLDSEAAYIGVIGSRKRWATTQGMLLESGISQEVIHRIRSPIGLALNAETPKEIALSIMAEILMVQKAGISEPMSGVDV